MSKHGTNETLTFTGLSGYYGHIPDGYGGFDWSANMFYMNESWWQNIKTNWCDTGYQNVAEACGATAIGWCYLYGSFTSVKPKETFDLRSMVVASAWSNNQEWTITTYKGGSESGSINFYASTTAEKLHFKGSAFTHITSVKLTIDSLGSGGNTCCYGTPVEGYQLAFDDVKIHWNGKIPGRLEGHSGSPPGQHQFHHVTPAAHLVNVRLHASDSAHGNSANDHHASTPYHTQLLAFGHHPGGLTNEFALPQVEHLGLQ